MTTYTKKNPESIQKMFGTIAKQYDRTNAILSFQMHRYWNSQLIKHVSTQKPTTLLDLCCGTGEIAFGFLKKSSTPCNAYLLDFCPEMLECAKTKSQPYQTHNISYIQGDAQAIPLADKSVQAVTVAYGIRNVKEPKKCFEEAYRVLTPGGRFGILELTRPTNPLLRWGHGFYLRYFLPIIGKLSTSNRDAYEYLCQSIHTFVDPTTLEQQLHEVGFSNVKRIPLMGGVATVIIGNK